MAGQVFELTTGSMGAGKSYCRVQWLVRDYLMDPDAKLWTDIELDRDAIAEFVSKRTKETPEQVLARLRVISKAEVEDLVDVGPLEWFEGQGSLNGVRIVLDESQRTLGALASKEVRKEWLQWIAEARHEGATLEAITQTTDAWSPELRKLAAIRYHVTDMATERMPGIAIPWYDVFQLEAKVRGKMSRRAEMRTFRRSDGSREKQIAKEHFTLNEDGFRFYNSHQESSTGRQGTGLKDEWQRLSAPSLVLWFMGRNWWRFATSSICWILLAAFVLGPMGGIRWCFDKLHVTVQDSIRIDGPEQPAEDVSESSSSDDLGEWQPVLNKAQVAEREKQKRYDLWRANRVIEGEEQLETEPLLTGVMTGAAFISGRLYAVGEKLDENDEQSPRITGVDVFRGQCRLSDGTFLQIIRGGPRPRFISRSVSASGPAGATSVRAGDDAGELRRNPTLASGPEDRDAVQRVGGGGGASPTTAGSRDVQRGERVGSPSGLSGVGGTENEQNRSGVLSRRRVGDGAGVPRSASEQRRPGDAARGPTLAR